MYDSIIVNTEEDNPKSGHLKIVSKLGQTIYVDTVDIKIGFDEDREVNEHIESSKDAQWTCYGFNWPIFTYGTKDNEIIVLTAFNPTYQQRYLVPKKV